MEALLTILGFTVNDPLTDLPSFPEIGNSVLEHATEMR